MDHGFLVECWSFKFLQRNESLRKEFIEINTKKTNINFLKSFAELDNCIDSLLGSFVFDKRIRSYGKYTKSWFQSNGAILVDSMQGEIPLFKYKPSLKDKFILLNWSVTLFFIKIKNKVMNLLKSNNNDSFVYDIRICGGECNYSNAKYLVESHSLDYDLYLETNCLSNTESKYIVFLDSGMVEHPDYDIHNIKPSCTKDNYYSSINNFFCNIEDELSLPVVIALHPRLDIRTVSRDYAAREIKVNETPQLIRGSSMVIAHDSTAISFAVLWKKPLLIITTDEIEKKHYMSMEATSKAFNIKRINIDHLDEMYDWNVLSKEPIKKYSEYKRKYIKAEGTPEKNSWEIFFDEIKKYDRVNSV